METIVISTPTRIKSLKFVAPKSRWIKVAKHGRFPVVSILKKYNSTNVWKTKDTVTSSDDTTSTKTVYKDNWFDRIAIGYMSRTIQDTIGMRNDESGYESLVVASGAMFGSFDPIQQRQLVAKILLNAIPRPILFLLRRLPPPSKFTRQLCATITSIFFRWLVGPCEVRESEIEGIKEKNVVFIKKCRFLETSNCAGMCTNLCKIPTQEFMKNTLGLPINMVPNFNDMSCEYIFGEEPPSLQDDPALKQPCYKLCNLKHKHDTSCIS